MIQIKKYKDLTNNEIHSIFKARNEVFIVEQECIYQDIDGNDIDALHFLIKEDNAIIAYLRVLNKGVSYNDSVSIGRVLVTKNYRKKGYARLIMQSAIDYIFNETNENIITISAQEYLAGFYSSMRFVQKSEMYLEDDIPHVKMILKKTGPK